MIHYYLGFDTGATKSHALVADESGRALGLGEGGAGNPMDIGYDSLAALLRTITQEALSAAGISESQIAGAGFGIAGYDWPSQRMPILQAIDTLGLRAPVEIVNDAIVGLLAGAAEGWGIAIVAGTSCNAWGWDQERHMGRMTGFSWLGEAAGAHELIHKALQAVAHEWTRRGPPTRLTQAFVDLTGSHGVEDLLEGLTLDRIRLGAEAAPLVFQVAADGDPVAHELILWAGRELGDMACGVIRQLGFDRTGPIQALEFDVVLAGSFFNGSPLLAEAIRDTIHPVAPGARLVRLHVPPVVGGVLLGMEQAGAQPSAVRETLIESTDELLRLRNERVARPTTRRQAA